MRAGLLELFDGRLAKTVRTTSAAPDSPSDNTLAKAAHR